MTFRLVHSLSIGVVIFFNIIALFTLALLILFPSFLHQVFQAHPGKWWDLCVVLNLDDRSASLLVAADLMPKTADPTSTSSSKSGAAMSPSNSSNSSNSANAAHATKISGDGNTSTSTIGGVSSSFGSLTLSSFTAAAAAGAAGYTKASGAAAAATAAAMAWAEQRRFDATLANAVS
jgi:hypothetical protein